MLGIYISVTACVTSGEQRVSARNDGEGTWYGTQLEEMEGVPSGKRLAYVIIAPTRGLDAGREWLSVVDLPEELNAIFCFTEDRKELLCWTYHDPPAGRRGDAWLDAEKILVRIDGREL